MMTIEPYFHRIFRKTDQSRRIPRKPKAELDCEKISENKILKAKENRYCRLLQKLNATMVMTIIQRKRTQF